MPAKQTPNMARAGHGSGPKYIDDTTIRGTAVKPNAHPMIDSLKRFATGPISPLGQDRTKKPPITAGPATLKAIHTAAIRSGRADGLRPPHLIRYAPGFSGMLGAFFSYQ